MAEPIQKSALYPLKYPIFRWLWIATLVSNVGTMMQNVGAAWLMVELTNGQPQQQLLVSLLQSAATLPILLFSLPAGAFADIFDRKKLLIVVTVLSFLSAAALTLAYWFHLITPGWLLFFTFLIGTGLALYGPAWLASTTELVPDDDLPEAVTLNGISYNLARAIGPAMNTSKADRLLIFIGLR